MQSLTKIVFLADTHLGFDYPIKPRIKRRRRGEDFFNGFKNVLSYALSSQADFVVHGGDLFFRSKVPKKVTDKVSRILFEYAGQGLKLFLVPGNHERSKLPDNLLFSHPNIRIFRKPCVYEIKNIRLAGFPSIRDNIRGQFLETVKRTGWKADPGWIHLLCMHQAVDGATVGPQNFTFWGREDVVDIRQIPLGFHGVLTGHIHRRQVLKSRACPVIYPGSTERTSFAEKGEAKGFYEIELDAQGVRDLKFITLPARPMEDILINDARDPKGFLQNRIKNIHPDSIVRVNKENSIPLKITAAFLREVFPDTMNVQLGASFRTYEKNR